MTEPQLVRRLLDHPGPSTVRLHLCVFLVLVDTALTLARLGCRWSR